MKNKPASLSGRIHKWFVIHTIVILVLSSLFSLVCLFVVEDGFFDQELKRYAEKIINDLDPSGYHQLSDKINYYPVATESPYAEYDVLTRKKHEASIDNRHYHFMLVEWTEHNQGLLVSDVTDKMIVNHSLDDLMVLFLPLLLTISTLSYFVSRFLAGSALQPFNQLVSLVTSDAKVQQTLDKLEEIRESDVRSLLLELHSAWREKEKHLREQVQFNLGISHELRTPLQVAKHALELITVNDVQSQRALSRLVRSHHKMENISTAFLWLSSDNKYKGQYLVNSIIQEVIAGLMPISQKLQKQLVLTDSGSCYLNMPEDVAHVIISNIISNAIQHSTSEVIAINVDKLRLQISNQTEAAQEQKGFGVGLMIVQLLTEKFDVEFKQNKTQTRYHCSLYNKA